MKKQKIVLTLFMFFLLCTVISAEKLKEDSKYKIECDKDDYYFLQGTHSVYCNITTKSSTEALVDVMTFLVEDNAIQLQEINILSSGGKEKANLKKTFEPRAETLQQDEFTITMKDKETYELELVYHTDGLSRNEFWLNLKDDKGHKLELDPVIAGCVNDSATVYCENGTFTGTSMIIDMNISISNATLGASGEITIESTNGWINITNSTIRGYGGAGNAGTCSLTANTTIDITDSYVYCWGGTRVVPGTGYQGYLTINSPTRINITNSNLSYYGGLGSTGAGGNSIGIFESATIGLYNITIDSIGGKGSSNAGGFCYNSFNSSTIDIYGSSDIYIIGGTGHDSAGCTGREGGNSILMINSTYAYQGDSIIRVIGGPSGLQAEGRYGGNGTYLWYGDVYDMQEGANVTVIGGDHTECSTSRGGDALLLFDGINFTSEEIGTNIEVSRFDAGGSSYAELAMDYMILFDPITFGGTSPATNYHNLHFTGISGDEYKLGLFNSTSITDTTYVTCEQANKLYVGNDSALDSDLNITSSCDTVTYVNRSFLFSVQEPPEFNYTYTLNLNFSENVDVIIQDVEKLISEDNVNNISYSTNTFSEGLIIVNFRLANTNLSYQRYEILTPLTSDINDSLLVLHDTSINYWVEVVDRTIAPQPLVTVNILQANVSWANKSYRLTNKLLTLQTGKTQANINKDFWTAISVQLDEFTQAMPFLRLINESNTEATAEQIPIVQNYNLTYGTMWSIPNQFIDRSSTLHGNVYYLGSYGSMSIMTPYMIYRNLSRENLQCNSLIWRDGVYFFVAENSCYLTLVPDTHFNSSGVGNISIDLYIDDNYIITRNITYIPGVTTTDIVDIGSMTFDKTILNPILFIGLILLSVVIQFIVKDNTKIGMHAFLLGSIIITMVSVDFVVLAIIAVVYYILQPVKKVIGVQV